LIQRQEKAGSQFDRREDLFLSIAAEAYEQELDLPLFPKLKSRSLVYPGISKEGPQSCLRHKGEFIPKDQFVLTESIPGAAKKQYKAPYTSQQS